MDSRLPPPSIAVEIISDGECSPFPLPSKKKRTNLGDPPPTVLVIDDDPTPQKPNPIRTPSFVPDTPISPPDSNPSVVRCSFACADSKAKNVAGITGLICLESDNESEDDSRRRFETSTSFRRDFGPMECSEMHYSFTRSTSPMATGSEQGPSRFSSPIKQSTSGNSQKNMEISTENTRSESFEGGSGNSNLIRVLGDSPLLDGCLAEDIVPEVRIYNDKEGSILGQVDNTIERKGNNLATDFDKSNHQNGAVARKQLQKEEKARLVEERKRKRQEEKLQKEALKAETTKLKKIEKEKEKWQKGKFAIKSIVAEVDTKVLEDGSVGGSLLARFAEKGLSYRITSNPVERSILWKMSVPDQIAQDSSIGSEVPYVLLVYKADEFSDLVTSESLSDHIHRVQSQYPSYTVCYLTNRLMSHINKCEQNQYKNPSKVTSWRRPPVEEAFSKLTTHFTKVHSRQCIDEAELAEHVVGLTSSLANCQYRKKLTHLSVHANGSSVSKDFIDKNLIKKNVWLKSLVAIPKVQPRHAMAIWKRYPTMRSLLNVYMDPNRSVHDKEFLLKDLMLEGLLGKEDRRLGEVCSKRVYRIIMAQSGGIKTDDVEDGADFFAQ